MSDPETILANYKDMEIRSITFENDVLTIEFPLGMKVAIWDDGQNCCESRYATTDDDLPYHVGARFLRAEVREMDDAPQDPEDYGDHNQACLVVVTSLGSFTIVTHNEHNGYYGGFCLKAEPRGWMPGHVFFARHDPDEENQ